MMMKLAFSNFRSNVRTYLSLVISLAFTILVFLNFENLRCSDMFAALGEGNEEKIQIIVQVGTVVLGVFMFFFIWYATNVFLTRRKREIGVYVFMGMTNQKIGLLYFIETVLTGLCALVLGVAFGMITTWLFQMIVLAISDIAVDIHFRILPKPILATAAAYLAIYLIFGIKGYVSIVRSNILNLLSAARKNEYVRQNRVILRGKAALGVGFLAAGFYMGTKEGGMEVLTNVLVAVVLVIIGVYFLFGGLLPLIFQGLAKRKGFLYRKQRTLWVNSIVFRMKRNYRTYAMVCILGLCSVTLLATSVAMKYRYDNIVNFRNTYTFQLLSSREDLDGEARALIEKTNSIECAASATILQGGLEVEDTDGYANHGILSYSQVKELAAEAGLPFDYPEPGDDEIIKAGHLYLLSTFTARDRKVVTVGGKQYVQLAETQTPYLGYLQEQISFYIVSDREYERLRPMGEELHTYNYRVSGLSRFAETRDALDALTDTDSSDGTFTGRVAIDPASSDIDWIKMLYSLIVFLFLVFVFASGSIMFMRLYNDAFEERARYRVLRNMGFSDGTLRRSVACELGVSYALPLLVMAVCARFSVHALEKMMFTSLLSIYIMSMLAVAAIFLLCWAVSVPLYWRTAARGKTRAE